MSRGDGSSRRGGRWAEGAVGPVLPRESGEGIIDVRCEGESVVLMSLNLTGCPAFSLPTVSSAYSSMPAYPIAHPHLAHTF
jgi:hypothetical protein